MYTYFLAFLLANDAATYPPRIQAPYQSYRECAAVAKELNATVPELRTEEAKTSGAKFVCLAVVNGEVL